MNSFRLLLFFLFINFTLSSQNATLYVGTYTVNTKSEGIYAFNFNCKTGELSDKKLVVETVNPSFLAMAKNKLFTVSENGENGVLKSYILSKNGTFNFINEVNSNGAGPCHVQLNKNTTKVVVSNYGGGTIAIYNVSRNGELSNAIQVFNHNISNDKAHAHSAKFFKNNLFAADLGRDYLAHYSLNSEGKYALKKEILMEQNAGPRHFEISKKGTFIYIINELNSTISVLKNNNNNYSNIQNISTLEANYKGKSYCADIHLSKNEKFLYGSNRGENSIVAFKRNKKTGKLTKIQSVSVEGDWPRNFALSSNGKFMLVANQHSNNISVFAVDKKNGKLKFIKDYKQAAPVCLVF